MFFVVKRLNFPHPKKKKRKENPGLQLVLQDKFDQIIFFIKKREKTWSKTKKKVLEVISCNMVIEEEENEVRKVGIAKRRLDFGLLNDKVNRQQKMRSRRSVLMTPRSHGSCFPTSVQSVARACPPPHPRQHSRFADPKPAARPGAENAARPRRLGPTNKVCSRRRSLRRWVPVREFRVVGGYWSVRQPTAANV
jgi:hypothetical protein